VSGKCRVKSPEGRVQGRSALRTPHFIELGIWGSIPLTEYNSFRERTPNWRFQIFRIATRSLPAGSGCWRNYRKRWPIVPGGARRSRKIL
jgi:hypothetical protein